MRVRERRGWWLFAVLAFGAVSSPAWGQGAQAAPGSFARVGRAISSSMSHNAQGWITLGAAIVVLVSLACLRFFRPGALDGKRDVTGQPAPMWLAAAFVVFAGVFLGASVTSFVPGLWQSKELTVRGQAIAAIAGALTGIGMGVAMIRLLRPAAPNAGLGVRFGDVPRAFAALALAAPVLMSTSLIAVAVAAGISEKTPDVAAHPLLKQLKDDPQNAWVWASVASAVLLTPIVEELTYRAFFQSFWVRATGMPWASVLITSALFAATHALGEKQHVDWYALPTLFVLGVAMGSAYEKTGRLGVPILMHALFNAGNVWLLVRQQ